MYALTDTQLRQIECIAKTLMNAQRKQMTVDMIVKTLLEASCKITFDKKRLNITLIIILCLVHQYMHVIIFSIRCVCPTGFRKIGSSGSDECEDIDECFHNPDICGEGGECRNTQGS